MSSLIRLATEKDGSQIASIYAPYVAETAISFESEPPTGEEMQRRIGETLRWLPWLVCERDSKVLGYAYASPYRTREAYQWSASVSVYVDSTAHHFGVGRGLYASLFRILEVQGFYNLFAGITLPNDASVGLHGSCGFQQISLERSVGYKLGVWHDVSIWQLSLRPCISGPKPVTSLALIVAMPEWPSNVSAGASLLRIE
jgi:L-amino acid N-acyltransferase YncA